MKQWLLLVIIAVICFTIIAIPETISRMNKPPDVIIREQPMSAGLPRLLERWEVVDGDTVVFTGTLNECHVWVETIKYRK